MEGASASNVSHAAETRVMDSADEEPVTCYLSETDEEPEKSDVSETDEERELPSAVQDLLLRLEGEGAPITTLPHSRNKDFRKFFPKIASLSTMTGWRSQVRLRVLEAIGNCNTFESLDVDIICGGDISRLTESEWEVVFRGFKSSTVLETISLWDLEWSSDAEVESLCSQIGRMLNSSSVKKLRIVGTNLSARCWLNLASGLRGNPDSKLQSLDLYCAWEDASAVKHVADIINSATRLETLRLRSIGDMEEETVGILSQALIQSSSLKVLALNRVKWGEALLLNALARDDGNRSIERLELERMDGLGGCLREVLTSNPSLKEVVLDNLRMSSEEWHRLGEFIRDNAIATNTRVEVSDFGDERESIEALARAASSDVKDPTVELVLSFLDEEELMLSLNLLGRVLRGEIKSLKSFSISQDMTFLPNLGFLFTNQGRPESFLSTNEKTGETSVIDSDYMFTTKMFGRKYGVVAREHKSHSLGFVWQHTPRRGVQGDDGGTASQLDSPGNRCLKHNMGNGRKGGADTRVPPAEPKTGRLQYRVYRSRISIRRCKSWSTLFMRLSSSRQDSIA